jgi:hypothetical protein
MSEMIVWSMPGEPADFLVAPLRRAGCEYLTTIPSGWKWCWAPDMRLAAAHPDHRPREFDPIARKWSEFDGAAFVEMDPQP